MKRGADGVMIPVSVITISIKSSGSTPRTCYYGKQFDDIERSAIPRLVKNLSAPDPTLVSDTNSNDRDASTRDANIHGASHGGNSSG
jgi:hypothetical protein